MTMLHSKTDLRKDIENLIFWNEIIASSFPVLFDHTLKISPIRIVHYNTKLPFFSFVNFFKPNNIWMVENLQNFSFFYSLPFFLFGHARNIYLFYNGKALYLIDNQLLNV